MYIAYIVYCVLRVLCFVLRCVALRVMQLNIYPEAQAVKAVEVMAAVNCKRIVLAVFYLIHGITLVAGTSRSLSCFSFPAVSLIVVIHSFVNQKFTPC